MGFFHKTKMLNSAVCIAILCLIAISSIPHVQGNCNIYLINSISEFDIVFWAKISLKLRECRSKIDSILWQQHAELPFKLLQVSANLCHYFAYISQANGSANSFCLSCSSLSSLRSILFQFSLISSTRIQKLSSYSIYFESCKNQQFSILCKWRTKR